MADPISATAMALSVGASGMKAAGSLMGGQAENSKAQAQAAQMQVAASEARLRATEIDSAYREELSQTLSNLRSIRAGQNASIDSPTSLALEDRATDVSSKASAKAVSNELRKAQQAETDAIMLRRAGRGAMGAAALRAIPDLVGGASSMFSGINGALPRSSGGGAF